MKISNIFNRFLQFLYKLSVGALMIIAIILVIIIAISIGFNLEYDFKLLLLLSFFSFMVFRYVYQNKSQIIESEKENTSGFIFSQLLTFVFGVIIFCSFLVGLIDVNSFKVNNTKQDETVILYTDSSDVQYKKYYLSQQYWKDFNGNKHTLPFKVDYYDVEKSRNNKEDFRITYQFTWGKFYKNLADFDRPLVEYLSTEFQKYQNESKMNRRDFVELMITAVQDIPYSLILDKECAETDVKPCFGNIKLGINTPVEFVSSLNGDCDTRTVLLFTLLSRFNYDVAILNSVKYRHSVLGLHIPATGKYKTKNNKKYYIIETTARGCPIGYLHKDVSNLDYWDFVLINDLKV